MTKLYVSFKLCFLNLASSLLLFIILSFSANAKEINIGNGSNNITVIENTYQSLKLVLSLNTINSIDVNTSEGVFSQLLINNYGYSYNLGYPNLPVLRKLIEIPVNAKIKINIINSQSKQFSLQELGIMHQLLPAQPHVSKDTLKPVPGLQFNKSAYLTDNFFSPFPETVTIDYLGLMRGLNIARVNIAPISYNPVSDLIEIYTYLEIQIVFENPNVEKTLSIKKLNYSPYFTSAYKNIINYKPLLQKDNIVKSPVKYVIVSDPMFRDSLKKFVQWKIKKGFNVIQAYTDDPQVGTTKESIKNYLTNLYNNSSPDAPAPSFILLVGDVAQIPSFRGTGSQNYYYTDLYYAEYTGDYLPEAYYGRFSANNLTQLMPIINKTLEYEQYLMPDPSYLNNSILIAGYDNTYSFLYANGQMNYASTTYFNLAHGIQTFFAKYPQSANDAQLIKQHINDGAAFVNYSAHGSFDGWVNPGLFSTDVPALLNKHKYPLMIGNACYTQSFDKTLCFGETVTRAAEKGALAYIGASSESYWDEDFWWSVGFCNIDTMPKYGSAKSLGVYDRMFHSHGEPYSEWFTTLGQILFAGSTNVTESGSPDANFYWETYNLLGDPSLMLFLSQPPALKINFNKNVPMSINSVNFITEPYTYIGISQNDTLLGAALADSNGIANVNINNIKKFPKAIVVATAQNRIPFIDTIHFNAPDNAYLILNYKKIKKNNNVSNENVNFADVVDLDINVKNIGIATANNIKVSLFAKDNFITITDTVKNFDKLNSNDTISLLKAFTFRVDSLIPDGHIVDFALKITDDKNAVWLSYFSIILNAPSFKLNKSTINDLAKGNGNYKLEPGETANIIVPAMNIGHCVASDAEGKLITLNKLIKINKNTSLLGELQPDSVKNAVFNITADKSIVPGTPVQFSFLAISGSYMFLKTITIVIGSANEDFESQNFRKFKWNLDDTHPWVTTDSIHYSGKFSARSGYMNGQGSSNLTIGFNVNENDTLSFYSKINADTTGNYFQFYIDDDLKMQMTGYKDWTKTAFSIRPGYHTFKWVFIKYSYKIDKNDCAWLDYINFPRSTDLLINSSTDIASANNNFSLTCFPNPFNESINVSFSLLSESQTALKLYNSNGELVMNISEYKKMLAGQHSLNINTSELSPGLYLLNVNIGNHSFTRPIIKFR